MESQQLEKVMADATNAQAVAKGRWYTLLEARRKWITDQGSHMRALLQLRARQSFVLPNSNADRAPQLMRNSLGGYVTHE